MDVRIYICVHISIQRERDKERDRIGKNSGEGFNQWWIEGTTMVWVGGGLDGERERER